MSKYSEFMDVRAETEEDRLMEQYYEELWNIWNDDVQYGLQDDEDMTLNEDDETICEEYTQEEDDDDIASVSTVVIYPSVATTNQGAYVYCRPISIISHIIGYDSD
jgi:hypothetical protein